MAQPAVTDLDLARALAVKLETCRVARLKDDQLTVARCQVMLDAQSEKCLVRKRAATKKCQISLDEIQAKLDATEAAREGAETEAVRQWYEEPGFLIGTSLAVGFIVGATAVAAVARAISG